VIVQERFTLKHTSAVAMRPQCNTARERPAYLSHARREMTVDPLSEDRPLLPSAAEQLYFDYHSLVGDAMQVCVLAAVPCPCLTVLAKGGTV